MDLPCLLEKAWLASFLIGANSWATGWLLCIEEERMCTCQSNIIALASAANQRKNLALKKTEPSFRFGLDT